MRDEPLSWLPPAGPTRQGDSASTEDLTDPHYVEGGETYTPYTGTAYARQWSADAAEPVAPRPPGRRGGRAGAMRIAAQLADTLVGLLGLRDPGGLLYGTLRLRDVRLRVDCPELEAYLEVARNHGYVFLEVLPEQSAAVLRFQAHTPGLPRPSALRISTEQLTRLPAARGASSHYARGEIREVAELMREWRRPDAELWRLTGVQPQNLEFDRRETAQPWMLRISGERASDHMRMEMCWRAHGTLRQLERFLEGHNMQLDYDDRRTRELLREHFGGTFGDLEVRGHTPDALDALGYAHHALFDGWPYGP